MNAKNEMFKKLLPIENLFTLYQRLSETLITKIDVTNLNFDSISINNSIGLLCGVGIIQFDNEKNVFQKTVQENWELSDFSEVLYTKLLSSFPDAFLFINQADLKYDEAEAKFYIKRNSVSLDLSGLLMLLNGIEKICIRQNDIFILDKNLLHRRRNQTYRSFRKKTLAELKSQIEINEEYGVEGELAAMEFEVEMLKNEGINKLPERISEYNTNAGYDIVSFMCIDSLTPDKFIEVKSCSDNRWIFYISKNELEVAKNKQDNYFLYLYNRQSRYFRIIQNPYNYFVEEKDSQWVMEPQVYQIRSLENLS